jgi:ribosome-associated translation inhibitor RaiA
MEPPMLQVPLEIAFHNIESSDWAEQQIRARVADLEKLYDRLVSCRVRIDQRAKDLTGTIPPVVHIELGIPGRGDLVVSHEPEHLLRKYQHPDLHKAINEAFRIAERRLLDLKEQRDGRTKAGGHDAENQSLGRSQRSRPRKISDSCSRRRAASSTSTATRCCPATSTTSRPETRSITTMTWATRARSQPRCA